MNDLKKSIEIIIPAFNEDECIPELGRRLTKVFDENSNYDFKAIIIENGSTDSTYEKLVELSHKDSRFAILKLSRNFRMDGGLTAGLDYARADAVVLMTADLQDPPEVIPEFIKLWEKGYESVYAIVTSRKSSKLLRRINSSLFYLVAGYFTNQLIPRNVSDFRLVDRKVYEVIRSMNERNRFIRGLFAWVGFNSTGIKVDRAERFGGESNADTGKVIDLALKGIFAHSTIPLRLITVLGLSTSIFSVISFGFLLIRLFIYGVPFSGYGILVTLNLFVLGTISLCLGVVAEYLGLVYEEVKARPNYVVSEEINL